MIISASRRTDIPAFFSDWFYKRLEKGYVYIRNPMNIHQISNLSLDSDVVDCIVFWTKNPERFIKRLDLLDKYSYYFQYTITGYGKNLEPNVPSLDNSIIYFKNISQIIGPKRVIWRYDPIIITEDFDFNYHIRHFKYIASHLSGFTEKCVISFVDYYKKTIKNLTGIKYFEISNRLILELAQSIKQIGIHYDIDIASCAEKIDLSNHGISHGKCIDDKLIKEIFGFSLKIEKDKYQRNECGCVASVDIGAYNSCPHGCLYCYANFNRNQVRRNYSQHDKNSELLFGKITAEDKISDRKVISCKVLQKTLFDDNLYSKKRT